MSKECRSDWEHNNEEFLVRSPLRTTKTKPKDINTRSSSFTNTQYLESITKRLLDGPVYKHDSSIPSKFGKKNN